MNSQDSKIEVFDVFLCHNSEDKPSVREIAGKLAWKNIKPWLDEEQIRPGTSWQAALGQQIEGIKSAAVFVGNSGLGPWQDEEVQALLSQFVKRKCPVIPVVLPSAKATPKLPWTLENLHWVDFRVPSPDPFEQLIWGITGRKPPERRQAHGGELLAPSLTGLTAEPSQEEKRTILQPTREEVYQVLNRFNSAQLDSVTERLSLRKGYLNENLPHASRAADILQLVQQHGSDGLRKLIEAIQAITGITALNLRECVTGIPGSPKGFADRLDKIDELKTAIYNHESVLIHGPPGVGKTALCLKVWEELSADLEDKIIPISARNKEPNVLLGEIARELDTTFAESMSPKEKRMALEKVLGNRRPLIWLDDINTKKIDRMEDVRDALPGTCTFVVTSERAALGKFFRPICLDSPSPEQAVEMFLSLCGEAGALYETQKRDVREVCQLVQCLPIAIDLIAKKVIASGLPPVRHYIDKLRSLRQDPAMLEPVWRAFTLTYDELAPPHQRLFASLGVFSGETFSLDAVRFLGHSIHVTGIDEGVEQLHALSLVKISFAGRLSLQPMLKQYAELKMVELDMDRHLLDKQSAKYFLKYTRDNRWPHPVLDAEYGNVIGCIEWCKKNIELRSGGTLFSYIRDLLDITIADAIWIVFLYGRLLKRHGQVDAAREVYQGCLKTAEKEKLPALKLACLRSLGEIHLKYKKLPFEEQPYISDATINDSASSHDTDVMRETIYMINFLLEYKLEHDSFQEFESLAKKSLHLRDKIPESERAPGVSFAAARLVDFWLRKGDPIEARKQLDAEERSLDPIDRASRYCGIADTIVSNPKVDDFGVAQSMYEGALSFYEQHFNYGGCAWAVRGMGQICARKRRWLDAGRFYEQAVEFRGRGVMREGSEVAAALIDLARLWYQADEPGKGAEFWRRAEQEEATSLHAPEPSAGLLAEAVSGLAETLVGKTSDRAPQALDKGDKLYQKLKNLGGCAYINELRGRYYISLKEWPKVRECFDQAIDLRKQDANQAKLDKTLRNILDAYKSAGKPEIAEEFRQKYGMDSVETTVLEEPTDVEVGRVSSTMVGSVLKSEGQIQNAELSWRDARRKYEALPNTAETKARKAALYAWNEVARDYFSRRADEFLSKSKLSTNSGNSSYAESVLNELAGDHEAVGEEARRLGLDPRTLVHPFIKFRKLQASLRQSDPEIASALRNRFIQVGLPTYGFDERTSQGLESRWFILGCGLLLCAVGLVLWGFSLGKLTWDQQRLLVWALPLASGFAAAAFAGSMNTQARNWVPGLAITATGGFAVWLVTFFFLFPETKVEQPNRPEPSSTVAPKPTVES